MYDFQLARPRSLPEAVEAMQAEEAQPLSGGQTLIPTLKARLGAPGTLVDLTGIAELKGISRSGDVLRIGGATRHADVAGSAEVQGAIPALAALAGKIGDPAVRNRGTIGGSLANNDPAACYPSAALGLGATLHTSAGRAIAADDFFLGLFETALEERELLTAAAFPVPLAADYQKFEQPASRFALVGVFVARFADGARVAVTGASEGGVFRWAEAEQALSADFSLSALDGMSHPAEGMIGDLHGSPRYRAHLVGVLTRRAVAACG
ncbi:FAD binding domain-containing protein [Albimonas pacifica]|uniref:Carbon-monoxide dehydrogenase medium subunit n=1 Tax=Albimonas pacifica TaxID=1114924 RepID=A0A1I3IGG2_9RHOB|nr:xanthine dehydrogenase family protein subunit M [Albimonas pacifica]SFI46990.1 carbon-monoxide dehydrogenase medium subunit [Albimonas pacifica]